MRINTRNGFLKLNHPFRKTSTEQKGLSYIGPAIWNKIPEIIKKTRNLNTFKHKMKHYYLNDLSNPNLWNVGRFDYALAIIKNIFLFVKQIFLQPFICLFPASLWLKDHNENKAICLFCVILAILFFISLILLLTSTFFFICVFFLSLVTYFLYLFRSFVFMAKYNLLSYLFAILIFYKRVWG